MSVSLSVKSYLKDCEDLTLSEKEKLNSLYLYITAGLVDKVFEGVLVKYKDLDINEFRYHRDLYLSEADRRQGGDFYTPKIWVKEGHKYLSQCLGEDWQSDYVVWDLCCGTGNLTRGLKAEKYLSTLSEEDLSMALVGNLRAKTLQYDFLNDDIEEGIGLGDKIYKCKGREMENELAGLSDTKLYNSYGGKELLRLLLSGTWCGEDRKYNARQFKAKKLLILINPPYAAAGNMKETDKAKVGVSDTKLKRYIKDKTIAENLYSQFFYRIAGLVRQFPNVDIAIASYTSLTLWTGPKFESLRDEFDRLGYGIHTGFLFSGSEFAGCSGRWSCCFSILGKGLGIDDNMRTFYLDIKENKSGEICNKKLKECFYSVEDGKKLTTWVKELDDKQVEHYDAPQLSNALSLSKGKQAGLGNIVDGTLGYIVFTNNCVAKYNEIFGLSSCANMGHGFNVTEKNFDRALTGFMARRLIAREFYNERKEFMRPVLDRDGSKYKEFLLDSYVASIFNAKGAWSSLRNFKYSSIKKTKLGRVGCVEYLGDSLWNIYNEFFFMGSQEIQELAEKCKDIGILGDLSKEKTERFMYLRLLSVENLLSCEGREVLDLGRELVRKSFGRRQKEEARLVGLGNWDAGWYQIKKILTEDELKEFNKKLKILEDKMRPLIYELGFLK